MSTLVWGVKQSLLAYVRSMPDGSALADGGAVDAGTAFEFPGLPGNPLRFSGQVTLAGHSGMMHVVLADPALVEGPDGWVLEIEDPDDASSRLPFATLTGFDGTRATAAALTEDGADLFFGPYTVGTPVDPPSVRD